MEVSGCNDGAFGLLSQMEKPCDEMCDLSVLLSKG
jgi:hypothetical protein